MWSTAPTATGRKQLLPFRVTFSVYQSGFERRDATRRRAPCRRKRHSCRKDDVLIVPPAVIQGWLIFPIMWTISVSVRRMA
jgi:hypothetical protein